jgi:outer membrane protein OmpA-like peptidoglycan-associated protein
VAAIDSLFSNPDFLALWNYLKMCGALPAQDLGPLALKVTPGLVIRGVVRFGGYNSVTRTLEINPTKPEHVTNPTELVDTITHEMIHAVDDLQAACIAAGSGPSPLAATAAGTVPPVAAGTPGFAAALRSPGPSASDPCGETIDENAAALDIIGRVIQSNTIAGVGHPTVTFVNLIIRGDPAAFTFYNTCRTAACALPTAPARTAAMTNCSQQTIARFLPPAMNAALLPAHIFFEFDKSDLRADTRETLHLVALFLTSHPATTVKLIGHADMIGPAGYNITLGQRRADAVKTFLLGEGVPPAQIVSSTSVGATGASAVGSKMALDRRVEITP